MIDPDAQRRAFDAAVETHCANARASAAAETREWLREDMSRLQKATDPERAWSVSESILQKHEEYRDDSQFPNVRDLLSTFSRLR